MFRYLILLLLFFSTQFAFAQPGCTDPQAINFDVNAVENDGSCLYSNTTYQMEQRAILPDAIPEPSGLAFFDNGLWTHNDGGNPNVFFQIDTTDGSVKQSVIITNADNMDWEDFAESEEYLFLGDFGNNPGNRTDLSILRIDKNDLNGSTVTADIIEFSYEDQIDFTEMHNDHDFDCEAFFYHNDSLHLFSKNWVDEQTRHYVLPATPGTHVAEVRETFDVNGLITAADISDDGVVALLGYTQAGINFMWLFFDYNNDFFFSGNKRAIQLGSIITNSQTEGIVFSKNGEGFVVAEEINVFPQRLLHFTTRQWTTDFTINTTDFLSTAGLNIYPNPMKDLLNLSWDESIVNPRFDIYSILGQQLSSLKSEDYENELSARLEFLPKGEYILRMQWDGGTVSKLLIKQ